MAWAGWAVLGAFDQIAGVLAATCGQPDLAVEHLRAALTLHDAAGWRALRCSTMADLAAALVARDRQGDRAEAAQLADAAGRDAEQLELRPVRHRLERLDLRSS